MSRLLRTLEGPTPLVLDGGLGSMLLARGLQPGEAPERWVLERPHELLAVHRGYVEAGSEALHSCTFGLHPIRLATQDLEDRCEEVATEAVRLARDAGAAFVLGDIGPTGEYLPPVGNGNLEIWRTGFARAGRALAVAGVDALHVETISDRREALTALEALQDVAPDIPILISMTFGQGKRGFHTIMGDPLVATLQEVRARGAAAVGANCTLASDAMKILAAEARASVEGPLLIQPNAGQPLLTAGVPGYAQDPEEFAADLLEVAGLGVQAVGGCCGTDPRFVTALVQRLHGEILMSVLPEGTLPLNIDLRRDQVLQCLGYPRDHEPGPRVDRIIEEGLEQAEDLARAAGAFRYLPADRFEEVGLSRASGETLVLGLVTVGPAIEERVTELTRKGCITHALVLDAAGSAGAEAAADQLCGKILDDQASRVGSIGCRVSPGYGEWPLTAQTEVFRQLPHQEIGVQLLPSLMMNPHKSVSFALWLDADGQAIPGPSGCGHCLLERCDFRGAVEPDVTAHRPRLSMLDPDEVDSLVGEACGVLERVGVAVDHTEAGRLLESRGAEVVDGRHRIPERAVREALASAPGHVVLHDRQGNPAVDLGGEGVHFDPGSAAIHLLDADTLERREVGSADVAALSRLVDGLPNYAAQSTALTPSDVPAEIADRWRLSIALRCGRKPVVTGTFRKDGFSPMHRMLAAVRGGEKELAERPLAVFDCCPSAPLRWSDLTAQVLIDCARSAVPATLVAMPLTGATAPVTLRGAVVQHCAENLSGLAIHQAAAPGAPVVYGGATCAFDMRQGTTPMGAMETMMIQLACTQLGRHLGLPTHAYLGLSDAKVADYQAGMESGIGAVLGALAGVNLISGPGMLDYILTQSLEKLVLDHEACGHALRLVRGIGRGTEELTPLFADLVKAGSLLAHPHTRKHWRTELTVPSPVLDRMSYGDWKAAGGSWAHERGAAEVRRHQSAAPGDPLPKEIGAALAEIMTAEARPYGPLDLPEL